MVVLLRRLAALFTALALVGCATATPGARVTGIGTVNSISEIREAHAGAGLLGSVGGALAGGMLGSLIGGGTGRTIATGVGATLGGAVGGQAAAQAEAVTAWDVSIRFEDGIDRVVRTYRQPGVRPGARVEVSNGVIRAL